MEKKESFIDIISDYSFKLSLCEISLGGVLHGLRIPLSGHFLSLNQLFFLTLVVKKLQGKSFQRRAPLYISQISALLKTLTPVGKKLGPMISISMQGNLFVLPMLLMGVNGLSVLLGAVLLSWWAFIQPLLTLYIYFGHNLVDAVMFYLEKIQKQFSFAQENIIYFFLIPVALKTALALVTAFWVYYSSRERPDRVIKILLERVKLQDKEHKVSRRSRGRELLKPFYLLSFFLTFLYLYLNREILAPTVWVYLRPFAILVLVMMVNRWSLIRKWTERRQNILFFKVLYQVNQKLEQYKF